MLAQVSVCMILYCMLFKNIDKCCKFGPFKGIVKQHSHFYCTYAQNNVAGALCLINKQVQNTISNLFKYMLYNKFKADKCMAYFFTMNLNTKPRIYLKVLL
jgi:hypothetical protein